MSSAQINSAHPSTCVHLSSLRLQGWPFKISPFVALSLCAAPTNLTPKSCLVLTRQTTSTLLLTTMSYSTRYEDLANDSFVLNAKLALRLAGEDAPVVASLEASNATGSKFILRPKSVIRPLSKAGGWTRISEQYVVGLKEACRKLTCYQR